jgi:hypothetical protein
MRLLPGRLVYEMMEAADVQLPMALTELGLTGEYDSMVQ